MSAAVEKAVESVVLLEAGIRIIWPAYPCVEKWLFLIPMTNPYYSYKMPLCTIVGHWVLPISDPGIFIVPSYFIS